MWPSLGSSTSWNRTDWFAVVKIYIKTHFKYTNGVFLVKIVYQRVSLWMASGYLFLWAVNVLVQITALWSLNLLQQCACGYYRMDRLRTIRVLKQKNVGVFPPATSTLNRAANGAQETDCKPTFRLCNQWEPKGELLICLLWRAIIKMSHCYNDG